MKTIKLTSASPALRVGSYESPEVKVTEIHNEGVLCASMQGSTNETWEEEDLW